MMMMMMMMMMMTTTKMTTTTTTDTRIQMFAEWAAAVEKSVILGDKSPTNRQSSFYSVRLA
jgi:hypothetical protein